MTKYIVLLGIAFSLSSLADEIPIPNKTCKGVDKDGNQIVITVSARTKNGVPITGHSGPLFHVDVLQNSATIFQSDATCFSNNSNGIQYSSFAYFTLSQSRSIKSNPKKANIWWLYLSIRNADENLIMPAYNALEIQCADLL